MGGVGLETQKNIDIINSVTKDIRPSKTQNSLLNFSGPISNIRSFLYALMCGGNNEEVNELELIAACNKFGVDNPTQPISRRFSLYGNDEAAVHLLQRFKDEASFDTSLFAPA
jgi:hypothetical protein